METGRIVKALSGFYYVRDGEEIFECRARGKLRLDGTNPLVGDIVEYAPEPNRRGTVTGVHKRKNSFVRPAVANIDTMVVLAAAVNPITDPFLIDRVTALAEDVGCEIVLCINKCDLDRGDHLWEIYKKTPYTLIRTSAKTGEGIEALRAAISGRLCAFTGNSGVGKSSLLNALSPGLGIAVGEVSERLGRGRHTTRHVEIYSLGNGAYIADTPGFASFDMERTEHIPKENLQYDFPEFTPYLGRCRFDDCSHRQEPGCAVLAALGEGKLSSSRHASYLRLYDTAAQYKQWENK